MIHKPSKKIRKVYKYATGEAIPEGAIYLSTQLQTEVQVENGTPWIKCWLVWHYFLVEVEEEE